MTAAALHYITSSDGQGRRAAFVVAPSYTYRARDAIAQDAAAKSLSRYASRLRLLTRLLLCVPSTRQATAAAPTAAS